MIDPLCEKIAKAAHVSLEEILPEPGHQFGIWWTVLVPGPGPSSYWFYGNKAIPDGTILQMLGGKLFKINKFALLPFEFPE